MQLCHADHFIFVGDMINKGPKNMETMAFIRSLSNASFVRGNHEDATLHSYFQRKRDASFKPHMQWTDQLTQSDAQWLVDLPFTLTLPNQGHAIIVHAGLVPGVPLNEQKAHDMTTLRNLIPLAEESIASKCGGGAHGVSSVTTKGHQGADAGKGIEKKGWEGIEKEGNGEGEDVAALALDAHFAGLSIASNAPDPSASNFTPSNSNGTTTATACSPRYLGSSIDVPGSSPWAKLWTGPRHVFFGHDAKRGLQFEQHATGLDSGCVYGKMLSACLLPSRKIISVNSKRVYVAPGGKY